MRAERTRIASSACGGKALPVLVVVQLVVAIVALAVMVYVGAKIGPLLQEKERLEAQISAYQQEVATLQTNLKQARTELEDARKQLGDIKSQLDDTRTELEQTRQRLRDTADMARYMHRIDPVDLKVIFSRFPRQARALARIMQLKEQGVGWHLGGQKPSIGFDSPSFATYVLNELHLPGGQVQPGDTLLATSRRLFDALPPINRPQVGDLAFYPAGYVLFYFEDKDRKPFVIGMTPSGIAALDPDFAKPVGYRKSGLAE